MSACTFGPVGEGLGPERIESISGSRHVRSILKRAAGTIVIVIVYNDNHYGGVQASFKLKTCLQQ
jgi:hypothetical protein